MKRIPDEVSGSAGPTIENWVRSFWGTTSESPDLPPHHPDCLGCVSMATKFSPLTASSSPRWWPRVLPGGGQLFFPTRFLIWVS